MNEGFDDLNQWRQERMDRAIAASNRGVKQGVLEFSIAGVLGVAAAAWLGILLTRSITRPITGFKTVLETVAGGNLTTRAQVDSKDEIGHLGSSLNGTLQNLQDMINKVAQASGTVASGATQLSASSDEISATTRDIARSGELLHEVTETVASAVVEFMASVEQVAKNVTISIDQTQQAVQATTEGSQGSRNAAERMDRINQATAKISSAVMVIQEIAQQTNLLSLNAAIEAAKAGDAGKGFAVVAEEVRKLAERSQAATVEIDQLILETQSAVAGGVASVSSTTQLIGRIHEAITAVSARIQEIGHATREQSTTAGEIAKRMEESSREVAQNATATQQLSATVQEISRTAADLAHVSESMATAVAAFTV